MPCLVTQKLSNSVKKRSSEEQKLHHGCHEGWLLSHVTPLSFTFKPPLLFLYERSIPYTPFGITTEKELILFGSRRLCLPRQNDAEFDGEENYRCKDPKNNSVIATWAVDHRCKSDFTVITQITSAAVYSAVLCISRIPCGLEVYAQHLLKLFAGRVEGTVFNLCSFVVAISSHWETRVKVFSILAVRWTVNGKHFSLTACVAAATLDARDRLTYKKSNHKNV